MYFVQVFEHVFYNCTLRKSSLKESPPKIISSVNFIFSYTVVFWIAINKKVFSRKKNIPMYQHINYNSSTNLHETVGLILTKTLLILAFLTPVLFNIPRLLLFLLGLLGASPPLLSVLDSPGLGPGLFLNTPSLCNDLHSQRCKYHVCASHPQIHTVSPNLCHKPSLLHKSYFVQKLNS